MKQMTRKLIMALLTATAALTANAAVTPYQQAVLDDSPLLYWTFDEASGGAHSLVNDTPDNVLTPMGTATRGASTTTSGGASLGSAAQFNGTTGDMFRAADLFGDPTPGVNNNSPGQDFIATQIWAVEFWFNATNQPSQYFSETFDGGGNSNNPGLIYNFNPGQVEMFSAGQRFGPTGIAPDQWHHVVFAFYGNNSGFGDNLREIYVDGVLTQDTTTAFSSGHGLQQITIGNAGNGTVPVNGMIDEYAIYELGNLPDLAARRAHVADIVDHRNVSSVVEPPLMGDLIENVSYVYNNPGDYNATAGKDNLSAPFALADGLGKVGEYTPAAAFWGAGEEGTIYLEDDVNVDAGQPQPGLTFDLGEEFDLSFVDIHYGHHFGSGVIAPLAVEIFIDGNLIGTFEGFDRSSNVSANGDIRLNTIDLTGESGQFVVLNFLGDSTHPHPSNTAWLGLTEIEFYQTVIPEPTTFSVLALGLLGFTRSRRRMPAK